jgi:hypothetical protein
MASLRSMILDGRMAPAEHRLDLEKYSLYFDATQRALRSHDTILVNATSVGLDLRNVIQHDPSFADRQLIPCPKPPYRAMWLEFTHREVRFGYLVRRTDIDASADRLKAFADRSLFTYGPDTVEAIGRIDRPTVVEVLSWYAAKGYVEPEGDFIYWLNADGDYQSSLYGHFGPLPDSYGGIADIDKPEFEWIRWNFKAIIAGEYWVLHTFARMNCHNVKLVPAQSGAPRRQKKGRPPCSVWHEIAVTSLAQLRREQKGEIAPDGEKRDIRFHKVRGHFADYTKGKGLFGKLKIRIWIEEHTAGDPELGTVVGRYKVAEKGK